MSKYLRYKYDGAEEISVSDFLALESTPTNMGVIDFLKYKPYKASNLDFIKAGYSDSEATENTALFASYSGGIMIKPNTEFFIPKDQASLEKAALYSEGQVFKFDDSSEGAFFGYWETVYSNKEEYRRAGMYKVDTDDIKLNVQNEEVQVWIYLKAIDEILNITPFINYCNTNKAETGSFRISANPFRAWKNAAGNIISDFSIGSEKIKHTIDTLEEYVQMNDIVFIRFEKLMREKGFGQESDVSEIVIDKSKLSPYLGVHWDMIGLVDNVTCSFMAMNTDKTINISGRDFTKLLTDDGSYFLPYKYIEGKDVENKFVWGGSENDSWFKRNMIDGDYQYFFSYELKPVDKSLQFIINHLSNIEIAPSGLFDAYSGSGTFAQDLRSKKYTIPNAEGNIIADPVKGVWQIIKLVFDYNSQQRVVSGENLINPNGSISDFFNSIVQSPFLEWWGDSHTEGTFDIIVRQPPFTKKAIQDVVLNEKYITVSQSDTLNYDIQNEEKFYSWYSIEPSGQIFGNEDGLFNAIIPIINQPYMIDTFGNKGHKVSDMYLNRVLIDGENKNSSEIPFIEQLLNDLLFVVETNTYLPFTRKGSITINGDRRIKKGTFIKFEPTNELYYVDGVSHSFSSTRNQVDRMTTVNISRGMKLPAITGEGSEYTYFDIAQVELIKKNILNKVTVAQNSQGQKKVDIDINSGINKDAFDYFIQRKHFML